MFEYIIADYVLMEMLRSLPPTVVRNKNKYCLTMVNNGTWTIGYSLPNSRNWLVSVSTDVNELSTKHFSWLLRALEETEE